MRRGQHLDQHDSPPTDVMIVAASSAVVAVPPFATGTPALPSSALASNS
jgi:hypothetical protein